MKIKQFILYLIILGSLACFNAVAQKQFFITNYTTKNGLPENNVQSMVMDKNGFVWTTYSNGLMRFDGHNFRKFLTSDIPYTAFLLSETMQGNLLAVDVSGFVFEVKNNSIDTLRKGVTNAINYLIMKGVLPSKEFYFDLTTPHLNIKRDKDWDYPPFTMFPVNKEDCLIMMKDGIGYYHFNKLKKKLDLSNYSPLQFISINGSAYFFTRNKLYHINIEKWLVEECRIMGDFANRFYSSVLAQPTITKTFWGRHNTEACILSGYNLYTLKTHTANPLIVNSVFITDEIPRNCLITSLIYNTSLGTILIATDTRGLFVCREQKFRFLSYPEPEPGTNNTYFYQLELDSHTVYTDWQREFNISGGRQSKLNIRRNYSENIFRDKHGNLWYMDEDNKVCKYNPISQKVNIIANPSKEFILCYYEEGDSIWVGTIRGIGYIKNDTLRSIKSFFNDGSNSNLFQLMRWEENKLWFCNYTGLFKMDTQTGKMDTVKALSQKYTYNFQLHNGYLQVGTFGRGFYWYKNGKTVKMPLDKEGHLQQSYFFVNDSSGYVWIATNNGLYKTRFKDLENYFNDTTYRVTYFHYGEEDGIASPEFNGGCVPSHITLKNGYTSLPNVEGLVWFKPGEITDPDLNYLFTIDGVYVDDSLVNSTGKIEIKNNGQPVRIDFTTPYWSSAENLYLEYKLEGFNKQWMPLTITQRSVEFSNLKSGEYRFLLRKKNGLEPGSYITEVISFAVTKKYYETWWFLMLMFLTAVGIVVLVARIYAYNISQKNTLLEKSVKQRTLELSQANADLQQSINTKNKLISIISHDIVTPLRFITMVAGKSANSNKTPVDDSAKDVLTEIKNTSQKLHDNAQNILNWIKYQNNTFIVNTTNVAVSALVDDVADMLKEMSGNKKTNIVNAISDEDIILSDKNILSIILHNLISNSIKFTENGTIRVHAVISNEKYIITVEDNGTGMTAEQLEQIRMVVSKQKQLNIDYTRGQNGYGLGYVIITELVSLLKGKISIQSQLGQGTCVELIL